MCLINLALRHKDVWLNGSLAPPFSTTSPDGGDWSVSRTDSYTLRREQQVPIGGEAVKKRKVSFLYCESSTGRPCRRYTD